MVPITEQAEMRSRHGAERERVSERESRQQMTRVHYGGLDELRAIAALVVVPGHIEQMKQLFGLHSTYWFPVPGKLGVVLFFVLSGFLVTSLLLIEREREGRILLGKFYLRRALRIWPLYFLIMCMGVFVFNQISLLQVPAVSQSAYAAIDLTAILLMIFVLPNFLGFVIPYVAHTWSIGVEQQFYFLQPLLINLASDYRILLLVLVAIVFSGEIISSIFGSPDSRYFQMAVSQLVYFGCIAIGCIAAILHFRKRDLVRKVFHNKYVQLYSYSLFILFLVMINKTENERVVDFRFHAVVFSILIVNIATNQASIVKARNRVLAYVGKISYGVYMYHPISIGLAILVARHLFDPSNNNSLLFNVFAYFLTFFLTILISAVSYRFYESHFLQMKRKCYVLGTA